MQSRSIVPFRPRRPSYPSAKACATFLATLLLATAYADAGAPEAAAAKEAKAKPSANAEQPVADAKPRAPRPRNADAQPAPSESPAEFRGPDVTLIAGEERTIYEYRQNGQLRMIKVVPKFGKPYYLAPRDRTRGWGDLEQADMLLPEWVLIEF